MTPTRARAGFTLVEIMVVVIIIGLLATIAIPGFIRIRANSQASSLVNNFRVYAHAFEIHAIKHGFWPPDVNPGEIPQGMEGSLPGFERVSIVGGQWDWEYNASGVTAGVSLRNSHASPEMLLRIDLLLDDGNLGSGNFRTSFNGAPGDVTYILLP